MSLSTHICNTIGQAWLRNSGKCTSVTRSGGSDIGCRAHGVVEDVCCFVSIQFVGNKYIRLDLDIRATTIQRAMSRNKANCDCDCIDSDGSGAKALKTNAMKLRDQRMQARGR